MSDETLIDAEELETIEFTTSSKKNTPTKNTTLTVQLGGETLKAPRPKDGVLFFSQSAVSDNANDADRWAAAWNLLNAVLDAQDRHRFLQRATDRDDSLNAAMMWDMIGQLMDRWSLESKIPASVPVIVKEVPHAEFPKPVRVVNDDVDLDVVAHPPKDIILGLTASALSSGATISDQAWVIGLFLDAALGRGDVLSINYRLRSNADELDLTDLTGMVQNLITRWYDKPVGNRKSRRAQESKSRKSKGPRKTAAVVELEQGEEHPGQTTLESALEE